MTSMLVCGLFLIIIFIMAWFARKLLNQHLDERRVALQIKQDREVRQWLADEEQRQDRERQRMLREANPRGLEPLKPELVERQPTMDELAQMDYQRFMRGIRKQERYRLGESDYNNRLD